MLYFLHGDLKKANDKATALVDSMLAKRPDANVIKMDDQNISNDNLQEAIGSQSLFTPKYIIRISHIFDNAEAEEIVLNKLKEIVESENVFIWIDKTPNKKALEKIEKVATKVQEFNETKIKSEESINLFSLTDALGERNSKKLWLLYIEAIQKNSVEEINGILWWQVKSMIVASLARSADEAGMKPFVFNKSRSYAENFSVDELEKLADNFIENYHLSRRGGIDLEERLEKLILDLGKKK